MNSDAGLGPTTTLWTMAGAWEFPVGVYRVVTLPWQSLVVGTVVTLGESAVRRPWPGTLVLLLICFSDLTMNGIGQLYVIGSGPVVNHPEREVSS